MSTLARVGYGKANHIRQTTVDEHLALAWDFNAAQCKKLSRTAQGTDPTITIRSAKIGIEPGELQRRLEALPEPLRVIAMDYFYGALPPAGRSSAIRGILRDVVERIKPTAIDAIALEQRR